MSEEITIEGKERKMTIKQLLQLLKYSDPENIVYIRYEHVENQRKSVTLIEDEVTTIEESGNKVILY